MRVLNMRGFKIKVVEMKTVGENVAEENQLH